MYEVFPPNFNHSKSSLPHIFPWFDPSPSFPHPHSLTLIQVTGPNGHICFYFHDKKAMRDAIEWIQARKEGHVANMVDAVGMDVKEAKTEADAKLATKDDFDAVMGEKLEKL